MLATLYFTVEKGFYENHFKTWVKETLLDGFYTVREINNYIRVIVDDFKVKESHEEIFNYFKRTADNEGKTFEFEIEY